MKPTQERYCMARAKEILERKKVELKKHCLVPRKELTVQEKIQQIKDGDADLIYEKVKPETLLLDAYTYDEGDKTVLDYENHNYCLSVLTKQYRKVTDQIMLGETKTAIELLENFETFSDHLTLPKKKTTKR